jgi:1,4-alpha-glucan branching enzyme
MGWMHDTLKYFSEDAIHRKYHHSKLTFRRMYAYAENFVLPLSHDEVVHGKGSLLGKMSGDEWQKFANLRLLYAYMWATPGKKLLFMGGELAQRREWNHDGSLDWHLASDRMHGGVMHLVGELNRILRMKAMHELDLDPAGFEWIDANDADQSVLSFERRDRAGNRVVVVLNATPIVRRNYRIGVDRAGVWHELLNTDAPAFGGSGQGNLGGVEAAPVPSHGRPFSLNLTLPPLSAIFLTHQDDARPAS